MQVAQKYAQLSATKPKLQKTMRLLNAFYLATAAIAAYVYHIRNTTHITPLVFLGIGLQFLASRAMRTNSAGLLVTFSTITGLFGAYLLYAGVGRAMTAIQLAGAEPLFLVALVVNAFGAVGHLVAVYFARVLVDAMRITVKKSRVTSNKKQS